jgi:hypothetical protein
MKPIFFFWGMRTGKTFVTAVKGGEDRAVDIHYSLTMGWTVWSSKCGGCKFSLFVQTGPASCKKGTKSLGLKRFKV